MMSPKRRIDADQPNLLPGSFARYVQPDLDNFVVKTLYYRRADGLGMLYSVVAADRNRDEMPVLRRAKHEAFAQGLAAGKTAVDAYRSAGFAASYANSSRLQRRDSIRQRVAEIVDRKQRAADRAIANAAERVGVDEEWVLRNLRLNALMAMRHGDRSAAARSLELIGRHLSMFSDRKQIEVAYVDDADEYLAKIMALVGTPVVEHEAAPLAIDHEPAEP
jgi:hypothetical protein